MKHFFFFYLNAEINFGILIQFSVFKPYFINQRGKVPLADTQILVLCFSYSEFQNLINQIEQS